MAIEEVQGFVCVGNSGKSSYSTDGTSWVEMTGLTSNTYLKVTYGNDRFVCVGSSGVSSYSLDGINWTTMTGLDTTIYYQGVAYGEI